MRDEFKSLILLAIPGVLIYIFGRSDNSPLVLDKQEGKLAKIIYEKPLPKAKRKPKVIIPEEVDIFNLSPCEAFFTADFKNKLRIKDSRNSNTLYYYNTHISFLASDLKTLDTEHFLHEVSEKNDFYYLLPALSNHFIKEIELLQKSNLIDNRKKEFLKNLKDGKMSEIAPSLSYNFKKAKNLFLKNKSKETADQVIHKYLYNLEENISVVYNKSLARSAYFLLESTTNENEMAVALRMIEELEKPDLLWFNELEPYLDDSGKDLLQKLYIEIIIYFMSLKDSILVDHEAYQMAYKNLSDENFSPDYDSPKKLKKMHTNTDREFYENSGCDDRYLKSLCDKYCK